MKKKNYIGYVVAGITLTVGLGAFAALQEETPGTWSKAEGRGEVTVTSLGADVQVSFDGQGAPPSPAWVNLLAVSETGSFSGDYSVAGIEGVTFVIRSDGYKPAAGVLLQGASGRQWLNENVKVTAVEGVGTRNYVSFDLSAGWETSESGDLAAMWAEDLQNVQYLGVSVAQKDLAEQNYTIEDFSLMGKLFETRSEVADMVRAHFGVDSIDQLSAEQRNLDSDGDGMSDLNELLAGTDANDAASVFAASLGKPELTEIVPPGGGDGIVVRWPCLQWEKYVVYRSDSMAGGFEAVHEAQAQADGIMEWTDTSAEGDGPYFYKIKKEN